MIRPNDEGHEPDRSGAEEDEDPGDAHGVPDVTLGGYFETHDRPPGFDGADGQPYSVSMEVEKVASLKAPFVGYLVFPRWAETGLGVVGHVQTPVLLEGRTHEEVEGALGELSLYRTKELLDEAIQRKAQESGEDELKREGGGDEGSDDADPREVEWRRWRRD